MHFFNVLYNPLSLNPKIVLSQDLQWVKQIEGYLHSYVDAVKVTPNGTTYAVGSFNGPHNFGNGVSLAPINPSNGICCFPKLDAYIAKYQPNGACVWAFRIGGNKNDIVYDVDTDESGNIYIVGTAGDTTGNVSFQHKNGFSTYSFPANKNTAFLAKYSPSGNLIFVYVFPSTNDAEDFRKVKVFGNYVYAISSSRAVWLIRLDKNSGVIDEQFKLLLANNGTGTGFSVENGSIYVTGRFIGTASFGVGSLFNSSNGENFVVRYRIQNNKPVIMWKRQLQGNTYDLDVLGESLFIVGNTSSGLQTSILGYNIDNGNLLANWSPKTIASSNGYAILSNGNRIIVSGVLSGANVNFGNGYFLSSPPPPSQGSPYPFNGYYAEYLLDGTCVNAQLIPVSLPSGGGSESFSWCLARNDSRIVVGGRFYGNANFISCNGSNISLSTMNPFPNGFFANYSQKYTGFDFVEIKPTGVASNFLCSSPKEYSITNLQDAISYTWSAGPGITLTNANTPIVTATAISGFSGESWIECTIVVSNACYVNVSSSFRKNLWVGVPSDVSIPDNTPPYNYTFCSSTLPNIITIPLICQGSQNIIGTLNGNPIRFFNNVIQIDLQNTPIGTYTYQIVGQNFCGVSSNVTTVTIIIDNCIERQIVEVSPNPTDRFLKIKGEFKDYKIIDKYGRTLIEGNAEMLDLQNLEEGIYFMHIKDNKNEEAVMKKIVVKK